MTEAPTTEELKLVAKRGSGAVERSLAEYPDNQGFSNYNEALRALLED